MSSGSKYDFQRLSTEPQYWFNRASGLYNCAGFVWFCLNTDNRDKISKTIGDGYAFTGDTWQVYRLLCGMSMELLYKSLIVQSGEIPPATHKRLRLANLADIAIDRKEQGLLEYLTECIIWEGRYPIPKSHEAIDWFTFLHFENLFFKDTKGTMTVLRPLEPSPIDWNEFSEVWKKAAAQYELLRS